MTEREHDGRRRPGIDKTSKLGTTRLRVSDSRHSMHHSIRDALCSASAVTLLPGFPAGQGVTAKATGSKVGVIGFDSSIAGEFPAHPLPGCLQVLGDTDTDIAGDV